MAGGTSNRSLHLVLLQLLFPRASPFRVSVRARPSVASVGSFVARNMSASPTNIIDVNMPSTTGAAAKTQVLPSFSRNVERTLDPCVVLMKDLVGQYADSWKDKGGIYSLAQGVVYWKPPEQATVAMKEALDDIDSSLHLYGPDEGLESLREELCKKVAKENGLDDHHVMVTVGANQAYVNCVLTLMHDTDKCVVFAPYYFNHVMALQMTLPESSMVVGPSTDNGTPDAVWLERALQNDPCIKVVTIVNPGNPTGTHLSRGLLQKIVDLCRQYNAWLVLDCTYEYFVPNSEFDGCFSDPHVLHIFSFSKAYALAGYRCGYLVIPKSAMGLYEQMMKVQDTIPIAPPRISQVAALASLSAGKEWVQSRVATLNTGRQAILEALRPLEKIIGGSGAMYVMGKLPLGENDKIMDDQEFASLLVKDFGVAVIPGSFCGFPGWIRVCYANLPPEQCLRAAERLADGLRTLIDGQ
ncbi:hypothetical protein ACA910_005931 [Epithemia clementina (nom. ined.)]